MMDGKITMLVNSLPGLRLLGDGKTEPGAIVAFRNNGDEGLYVADVEEDRGMAWIPVGEFSVDPEAVMPPPIEEEGQPIDEGGEGPIEVAPTRDPFGGRNLKRRSTKGE